MASRSKLAEAYVDLRADGEARVSQAFARIRGDAQKTHGNMLLARNAAKGFFVALLGYAGVSLGLSAFIGFLKESVHKAEEAEQAQIKLRATLRATGNEVTQNSLKLNALASSLADTTHTSKTTTLSLVSLALNLGVGVNQVDTMARSAIGLSEALGIDATTAMEMLAKATQGNFKALQKAIPAVKNAVTEEEKLAEVQKVASRGLQEREALTHSLTGANEELSRSYAMMEKTVGQILAPTLIIFFRSLTKGTIESRIALLQLQETLLRTAALVATAGNPWAANLIIGGKMAELEKEIADATKQAILEDNKAAQQKLGNLKMIVDAAKKGKASLSDFFEENEKSFGRGNDEFKHDQVMQGKIDRAKARNEANRPTHTKQPPIERITPEQAAEVRARNDKRRRDSTMGAAAAVNAALGKIIGSFTGSAYGKALSAAALDQVANKNSRKAAAVADAGGSKGDFLNTKTAKTAQDDPVVIELKRINGKLPSKAVYGP